MFFPQGSIFFDLNELYTFFFIEIEILFLGLVPQFEDDGISFEFHVLDESIGEEKKQLVLQ